MALKLCQNGICMFRHYTQGLDKNILYPFDWGGGSASLVKTTSHILPLIWDYVFNCFLIQQVNFARFSTVTLFNWYKQPALLVYWKKILTLGLVSSSLSNVKINLTNVIGLTAPDQDCIVQYSAQTYSLVDLCCLILSL